MTMHFSSTMTVPSRQTIYIRSAAPPKPLVGAACNGCGVCCLVAPCPLGMVLSGRRTGACDALRWQEDSGLYRCGAISQPADVLYQATPVPLRGPASSLIPILAPALGRLAKRWVAAGVGCDCTVEVNVSASETIHE
jgi:hypothetical protein